MEEEDVYTGRTRIIHSLMLSVSQNNLSPKTHALLVWFKAENKWNSLF